MKAAYPIVMNKGQKYIVVYVPDFDINTQGTDYADAIEMARDAIGLMGIDMEDDGETIARPSDVSDVSVKYPHDVISLVDVDFSEYRRKNDMRSVRRNVSLPMWLNTKADEAGINVSAILQTALKKRLQIK